MDNRIFNINGSGEQMLLKTLELAFLQSGNKVAKGWRVTPKQGLVLYWALTDGRHKDIAAFPTPLGAKEVLPTVLAWLNGDQSKGVEMQEWDRDADHDGDNSAGWRVFCESWGHVADDWAAFIAIKPAMMWHGK